MVTKGHIERAAALLYVLVVVAITGAVLTASLYAISTRAKFHEEALASSKRRITLENSRALATQFLRENVLASNLTSNQDITASAGMGGFIMTGPSTPPLAVDPSSSALQGYNHFSPGELGGYAVRYVTELRDGAGGTSVRHFFARSRSPIFSGNSMNAQLPVTSGVTIGPASVSARTILWQPFSPNSYQLGTSTYLVPLSSSSPSLLTNLGGGYSLPSNFPLVPQTSGITGSVVSGDISGTGYDGAISVIHPSDASAPNSLYAKVPASWQIDPRTAKNENGIVCDGHGFVSIDLLAPTIQAIYLGDGVQTLRLIGQTTPAQASDAQNRFALLIVVEDSAPVSSTSLSTIQLQGDNVRRVYLAVKKSYASNVTIRGEPTGSPTTWRLAGVFENTPVTWDLGNKTFTLTGGFRTNSSFQVANGTMSIVRDSAPENLELRADRSAWLETFTPANAPATP